MTSLPQVKPESLEFYPRAPNQLRLARRWMNQGEPEVLYALVASTRPRGVLEFGCNEGQTAQMLLDTIPGIVRYQGIDVPPGYVTEKEVQRKEIPLEPGKLVKGDPRFELILRPRGSLNLTTSDLQPCDVAFIDGDHGRTAVEHDTSLAQHLVRSGGLIIWHDYHDLGTVDVREVLEGMFYRGHDIRHVAGTWLAFKQVH